MARHYRPPINYHLREIPVKQIKVWKDAQARKLDRIGIAELARSIKNEGLQNPPMVQKESKDSYLLMSGQRRLAALKKLGAKKIPALLLTQGTKYDLKDAKAASVIENIHRNKMSLRDVAAASTFLTESVGKSKAAQSLGISQQTLRKYLGFAAVPDKLKEYVPREMSRDDVTKLHQTVPNISKALQIVKRIIPLDQRLRRQYLRTLAKNPNSSHSRLLKKAKSGLLQQRIAVELNKSNAKKLQRLAAKNDMDVTEMAEKIVSSYLKRG